LSSSSPTPSTPSLPYTTLFRALLINGEWPAAESGATLPVKNPATGEVIGQFAHAQQADLDAALAAADAGFKQWRDVPANKRSNRSEEHTSELQSRFDLVCRLLL